MLELKNACLSYDVANTIGPFTVSLREGEVVGLIGPNGAGKTSFLDVICGIGTISGERLYNGIPLSRGISRDVAYALANPVLIDGMTPGEFLRFDAAVRGLVPDEEEITELLTRFGCNHFLDKNLKACSLGMRRRVSLAAAWQGKPSIILLDEPINGLDTEAILMLKREVAGASQQGSLVIMSAHILSLIAETCSRALLLRDGAIIDDIIVAGRDLDQLFLDTFLANLEGFRD